MSRIGKKPVPFPKTVKVAVSGRTINVEGPKGKLSWEHHPNVAVKVDGSNVVVTRVDDEKLSRALHGLTRALVANMVHGAAEGYTQELEIQGVGYKAELKGKEIVLSVGYANTITKSVPDGVVVKIEGQGTKISIQGANKQVVGQFAAEIRKTRKPEPYKGKGIRYLGEVVKRKLGKQFAGAGAK
jgi:large subunit ribosomal protein L6